MFLTVVISTSGGILCAKNFRSLPLVEMTEWKVVFLLRLSFMILLYAKLYNNSLRVSDNTLLK
jgi:hypothetical protein